MANLSLSRYDARYLISKQNTHEVNNIPYYTDYKSVVEVFNATNDAEVVRVISNKMSKYSPYFVGETDDLLRIFDLKMVKKETRKDFIEIEYELPVQERFTEVTDVTALDGTKFNMGDKIGFGQSVFVVTLNSSNFTNKNTFQLRDWAEFMIKFEDNGFPAGAGRTKYKCRIINGRHTDHLVYGKHISTGSEIINSIGLMSETQSERASVEISSGAGKLCYKLKFSRAGYERYTTDKAWQAGTYFIAEKNTEKSKDSGYMPEKVAFSELDVKFFGQAHKAFDGFLTTGKGSMDYIAVDEGTNYSYEIGTTFADGIRSMSAKDYSINSFDIDVLLSEARRKVALKYNLDDRANLVFDFWTGDGGWSLIGPQLEEKDVFGQPDFNVDYSPGSGKGFDSRLSQLNLNKRLSTGIYLGSHGLCRFNLDSRVLNSGVLTGSREYMGFKLSSYWIFMFVSVMDGSDRNQAIHLYNNPDFEYSGHDLGEWGPKGSVYKVDYSGAGWSRTLSKKQYKTIIDFAKGIFVDFEGVELWIPDFA